MDTALHSRSSMRQEAMWFPQDAFSRSDESDDRLFYQRDRMVAHLDEAALATVASLIGSLVVEQRPVVLDLMASWDSHLPPQLQPEKVVGLGLNRNELTHNPLLDQIVLHDLNADPRLPFAEETFDVVLNTVSVDYMTRPLAVFREVGRILKPGGLFLVIFSNRMFPQKATRLWREAGEKERLILVEEFFTHTPLFEAPRVFMAKGRPRPTTDKYADLGIPSDPIYAVYADRKGAAPRRRPQPVLGDAEGLGEPAADFQARLAAIKHTLACPYCGQKMRQWAVPNTPFTAWENEYMYICFNDACPYLVKGWDVMGRQGNHGISYRLLYDPLRDRTQPVPVPSLAALKDGIMD